MGEHIFNNTGMLTQGFVPVSLILLLYYKQIYIKFIEHI